MAILDPARQTQPRRWRGPGMTSRAGKLLLFGALVLAGFCGIRYARAQSPSPSHEYPLKAVFILNFARFTDWPPQSLQNTNAPFVIGILGDNPFGPLMEETVRGEEIHHHKFSVEYYRNPRDIKDCEILFIAKPDAGNLEGIMAALKNKPVLTVADFPGAARRGVCVQFKTVDNRIHLLVNLNALNAAHLTVSSELLQLAEIVSSPHK